MLTSLVNQYVKKGRIEKHSVDELVGSCALDANK